MEWFEYLIIVAAIMIVILPFFLAIRRRKLGKTTCTCDYSCGKSCASCPLKKTINELKKLSK